MRSVRTAVLVLVICAVARPARADITAFLGANVTPSGRSATGFAVGFGLLVVAFEFEYSSTSEDLQAGAPSLKSGMGNVLLQTPTAISGLQPYFTVGGGICDESLNGQSDTSFGTNIGGGVKISVAGPLRVRVDYRVFGLGSGALYSPAHRFYVGLNLKF